ncbi:N-acetylmuramoyl-L-alanine amidase [Clostridium nigeriense]|uniref:N-acetylmuramoyl-L-alanine amidase n=1 Tax=Clostridium nigeriense TaxID=1805470 RepID=UPI0008298575|nr:N-acetylmuramoyl-L-alanine amidase [Clostridium nigeriense]
MAKWVLDAGHGGSDSGAVGKYGRREADIVLEAVYETKRLLERNGEVVLLTRASDVYLDVKDRVDIANNWNADYFVSFHMNSFVDNSVSGTEIVIFEKGNKSEELARFLKDELLANLKSKDRGIKEASYTILRQTKMPAVIIEAEFISNEDVEKNFSAIKYGYMVARACLAMVNKVLIDIPIKKPKTPTREGWRICIGYYRDYEEAEDEVIRLQNEGFKDVYVVPYPEDN